MAKNRFHCISIDSLTFKKKTSSHWNSLTFELYVSVVFAPLDYYYYFHLFICLLTKWSRNIYWSQRVEHNERFRLFLFVQMNMTMVLKSKSTVSFSLETELKIDAIFRNSDKQINVYNNFQFSFVCFVFNWI